MYHEYLYLLLKVDADGDADDASSSLEKKKNGTAVVIQLNPELCLVLWLFCIEEICSWLTKYKNFVYRRCIKLNERQWWTMNWKYICCVMSQRTWIPPRNGQYIYSTNKYVFIGKPSLHAPKSVHEQCASQVARL